MAIIAILAAIAVPNFLEAQVRSKISRVMSDQRALATAIEAYRVDFDRYPTHRHPNQTPQASMDDERGLIRLSTPVAYIQNPLMADPFKPPGDLSSNLRPNNLHYIYLPFPIDPWDYNCYSKFRRAAAFPLVNGIDLTQGSPTNRGPYGWWITSYGPDKILQIDDYRGTVVDVDNVYMPYDSTNGSRSTGDIYRFGP